VGRVGQVLGVARGLYGAAPRGGRWSTTQALTAGRDGIAAAGGVVAGWGGVSASAHRAAGGGRVLALQEGLLSMDCPRINLVVRQKDQRVFSSSKRAFYPFHRRAANASSRMATRPSAQSTVERLVPSWETG
jgi:hypothetical protein